VGPDAARRRRGVRGDGALDGHLPGLAISLSVFAFNLFGDSAPGRARSAPADAVTCRDA